MTGILKRKFEEVEGASPCSSLRESEEEEISSTESGDSSDSVNPSASHFSHSSSAASSSSNTLQRTASSILKREKRMRTRRVHFEKVTVYYFSRRQGFTSVPSQGGSTLGMSNRHSCIRQYTLGEFAMEQERIHRDMLRDHLKEEKLNSIRLQLTKNGSVESEEANTLTVDDISDDDLDIDNTEVDEYFFLQPLTTKKRRALLRSSGVKKMDVEEKHELRAIRVSREDCGCDCRLFCDPETCTCSLAGIKCQVDRMSFPCGCTKEGCSNAAGRIEFNPIRVRTHFLHTIMKLELEKSREQQQSSGTAATGNGFHTDPNGHCSPLAMGQHALEYAIPDSIPPSTIMCLQAGDDMDEALEEEEEEEEEDEDEEEDDEDEEDEDESSSLCSLSDSSTQSLANSDSEEEEDDDDEDEVKTEEFDAGLRTTATSCSEVATPSVMCYPENTVTSDNQTNGNSYYISSNAEYYQLENAAPLLTTTNHASDAYVGDSVSYQDRINDSSRVMSQGPFNVTTDQYMDYSQQPEQPYTNQHFTLTNGSTAMIGCCAPDMDKSVQSKGSFLSQSGELSPMKFPNYLSNNNTQDGYITNGNCYVAEQPKEMPHNLPDISLTDNVKGPTLQDAFAEPTPV
ncbi:cysteine/serine-rich nuclear protein 3-like [Myxocyprinus asiaticus]|uniref:cysteine/serine-rich nuclear protein 3-like n=1 Tax=Myxocyprinus asiaticus TaxID=70543 RepID=UPI002222C763|nr:cysteine/serine-rich nuclear protein 3-like [Myxocyprinus asiaticus]XP_051566864.1 cysteine/serine-rich nuclear protein 3-like [Myxocyprinus asiaticus]